MEKRALCEKSDVRRLFFGLEVRAPWPGTFPQGRIIPEDGRHMTLAFLGNVAYSPLAKILEEVPKPPFEVGVMGSFEKTLFLPTSRPHVVSWKAQWDKDDEEKILTYQKEIYRWLKGYGYILDEREFLPHVTIARKPFVVREWEAFFVQRPFFVSNLHLYETTGRLSYEPIWTWPVRAPSVHWA
jgi:RNA 2',3'-cyclic 3'-phosphodiesterase